VLTSPEFRYALRSWRLYGFSERTTPAIVVSIVRSLKKVAGSAASPPAIVVSEADEERYSSPYAVTSFSWTCWAPSFSHEVTSASVTKPAMGMSARERALVIRLARVAEPTG
jgi:hypothetical protein